MTIMTAITIAKIGRLMKKFEITAHTIHPGSVVVATDSRNNQVSLTGRRIRVDARCLGKRFRINHDSWCNFLRARSHYRFAGFQTILNDPHRPDLGAERDGPNAHLVIAADDGDAVAALQFADGALGDEQSAVLRAGRGADSGILAGPQRISGI
jgi:hypothetical protein